MNYKNSNKMKKPSLPIFIVFIAIGLSLIGFSCCSGPNSRDAGTISNSALENILTRTSVRDYTDTPVSEATIDTLVRAGMAAPTARNSQPWSFLVVNQRQLLDSLAQGNWKPAGKAQAAIIVCGDMSRAIEGEGKNYWIQDCSAATENILLAAHAIGLGAVWCGCYPVAERVERVRVLFEMPDSIIPLSIVVLGYPKGEQTPKDKYKPENIHFNKW